MGWGPMLRHLGATSGRGRPHRPQRRLTAHYTTPACQCSEHQSPFPSSWLLLMRSDTLGLAGRSSATC